MSVATARTALAAAVDSISNIRCPDGYIRGRITPPEAMIDYVVAYDLTFARGADSYTFKVKVFDTMTDERSAQARMDAWRDGNDTGSIKYAIENYATAAYDYARVTDASDISVATVAGVDYLMIEFDVEVVL